MEDGEEFAKSPQRPKLGPLPIPKEPPKEESYGHEYYDTNTSMKEDAPPRVSRASKSSGGWLSLLLIVGALAYLYYHPDTLNSAIETSKNWVLSLRGEIFEEGKGYGDISVGEQPDTQR